MYDAIVVGARCAGAAAAMLLARRGHRVLLVDRATFPSEIPHGHFIHKDGPRLLNRWGLLDKIASLDSPPIRTWLMDLGDFPLVARDLIVDGVALGYAPRRKALDQVLVDAAVEAGVELWSGFVVDDFVSDGDRLTGIRGRAQRGGAMVTERGRLIIGADGRNSRLARAVQAPVYEATPALACWYFSYWSDVPHRDGVEIYGRTRNAIFAHPTSDGLFAVFVGWPIEEFHRVRSDIEGNFLVALRQVPELAERVRSGRRAERFYGTSDVPNFFRKPYGPGWALVGDAGCHKDPYLALGICDAFRDSELLAEAIDEGLTGRRPLDEALADYERRRNAITRPAYHENIRFAQFCLPPPEVYQLRAALRGNQADTNRFAMAREGMIPPEEFFNPENLQRIIMQAQTAAGTSRTSARYPNLRDRERHHTE